MYRVHEPPSREKLVALKEYLKTLEVEFALGQVIDRRANRDAQHGALACRAAAA